MKQHTGLYHRRCVQNSSVGITDFNNIVTKTISTTYKTNSLSSNFSDASIVVSNNNSNKENSGICSINAGILNLGTSTSDAFSASTIVIGSSLSTIFLRGNVIFDNPDLTATNLPDYIRQIVRSRI